MSLKLFNTLGRKKQEFKPIKRGQVSMYTCGPTVYRSAHIGNLRAYLAADILRRTLEYNGYKVKQIINITDVGHLTSNADTGEDKVESESKKTGKTAKEITKFYAEQFVKDIKALNIEMPVKFAWASKYIKEQIDLIKRLEKKGYTYKTIYGIYFDTAKFKGYGKLGTSGLAGKQVSRVAHSKEKKREADFALWKFSGKEKRQQEWKSPWGVGFPGWHIECSAISTKELGQPFDIHTGGIDHVLIHHNDEIAQSEAAYGKPLANFWIHNEFLDVDPTWSLTMRNNTHECPYCGYKNLVKGLSGYIKKKLPDGDWLLQVRCKKCKKVFSGMVKMSKSLGNFMPLTDLIQKTGVEPTAFRLFALSKHYRSGLHLSLSAVLNSQKLLNKLRAIFDKKTRGGKVCRTCKEKFMTALNNDLSMPKAMAVVWILVKRTDRTLADKQATLLDFDKVLGLGLKDYKPEGIPAEVKKLAAEREIARKKKDWSKADQLRVKIAEF